jgi:hypothetical protein
MSLKYEVRFITPLDRVSDPDNDNIDVEVLLDGKRYVATFFTTRNLETMFRRNAASGECAGGTYFWASDMIIVQTLRADTLQTTIDDLLHTGEFTQAFSGPFDP